MRSRPRKESSLERRMKLLQKESEAVRGDIRLLSRALKNPDEANVLNRLKSRRFHEQSIRPPERRDPVGGRRSPGNAEEGAVVEEAGSRDVADRRPERIWTRGGQASTGAEGGEATARNPRLAKDERFASYFSSGGFLGGRPLRQERNIQRNRAIAMLLVVGIVLLWVFYLVFQ